MPIEENKKRLKAFKKELNYIIGQDLKPTTEEKRVSKIAENVVKNYLLKIADELRDGEPVIYLREDGVASKLPVSLGVGDANIGVYREKHIMEFPLIVAYTLLQETGNQILQKVKTLTTYHPSLKIKGDNLINPPSKDKIRKELTTEFATSYLLAPFSESTSSSR